MDYLAFGIGALTMLFGVFVGYAISTPNKDKDKE